jgi:hypothetical protein
LALYIIAAPTLGRNDESDCEGMCSLVVRSVRISGYGSPIVNSQIVTPIGIGVPGVHIVLSIDCSQKKSRVFWEARLKEVKRVEVVVV